MTIGQTQLETIAAEVSTYFHLADQCDDNPREKELVTRQRDHLSNLITVLLDREYQVSDEFDHLNTPLGYEQFLEGVKKVLFHIWGREDD